MPRGVSAPPGHPRLYASGGTMTRSQAYAWRAGILRESGATSTDACLIWCEALALKEALVEAVIIEAGPLP